MTRWYCARTQPKHEHIAAAGLQQTLGIEVFDPRIIVERSTLRGIVRVLEPVFPCYIFVNCLLDEHAMLIRRTNGISNLVHFGAKIPAVPDEVIAELKNRFDKSEPCRKQDDLRPGMEVLVAAGVFLGLRGVVVQLLPAKRRVAMLMNFLGQAALMELDRKSVAVAT